MRNGKAAQHLGKTIHSLSAERRRKPHPRLLCRREVEAGHVGKDDRVGLRMRQAEDAEHVCELVLQRGARGEHQAGKPRRGETLGARFEVGDVGDDARSKASYYDCAG